MKGSSVEFATGVDEICEKYHKRNVNNADIDRRP
jgi:hypothetical protein